MALERVEDGLDPLTDAAEATEPGLLVFAVGSDQMGADALDEGFEVVPGEAFVPGATIRN